MSLRPPSVQRSYDDYVSIDPAFVQAPTVPAESATDAERALYKEESERYVAKLKAAKQTGDWTPLRIEGQTPTKFVLGQVDRNIWRALMDRALLSEESPRRIGQVTLYALLFRLALRSVEGFGDVKVERRPDPNWESWEMAQASLVTTFDELDPRIVGEIGGGIFQRLQTVSPLT